MPAPDGVDPALLSLAEPLAVSMRSLDHPEVGEARWAVVLGCGPIGLMSIVVARAAGALGMFLPGFMLASLLGRGGRFFLVAGILIVGGERMQQGLRRNIDRLGWATVAVIVVGIAYWQLR